MTVMTPSIVKQIRKVCEEYSKAETTRCETPEQMLQFFDSVFFWPSWPWHNWLFYQSRVYTMLNDPRYGLQIMSDVYVIDEYMIEVTSSVSQFGK